MLKSCPYCHRIHDNLYKCAPKMAVIRKRQNRLGTEADRFRRTNAWTSKSLAVRERDHHMCLCCKAQLVGTDRVIETDSISVHHIVPIEENFELRLEETNLISVCSVHHEMCEANKITRDMQRKLVEDSIRDREEKVSELVAIL